jgi:hypothetical protein
VQRLGQTMGQKHERGPVLERHHWQRLQKQLEQQNQSYWQAQGQ